MKILRGVLLLLLIACPLRVFPAQVPVSSSKQQVSATAPGELPQAGGRISLPGGGWFTWRFDKKPRLGTIIVKVQVFLKNGIRDTSAGVVGEYGMPSMRAHDSGSVPFMLSKKGDYLLPVEIAMPGQWALVIRISRKAREIYAGRALFNI